MFCRQCGSEIPNEAKFCTFCGAKTVAPVARRAADAKEAAEAESAAVTNNPTGEAQSAAAMNTETKAEASSNATSNQVAANAVEGDNGGPETQDVSNKLEQTIETDATSEAQPAANVAQTAEANVAASPEPSNLKAAVAQNKKRSRRHIPMIVLVALALALATSVAYAAYRVYTDVWVPYQAEQQEQAKQAEKTTGADGDTITEKVTPGEPENLLRIADILNMDSTEITSYVESQGVPPQSVAPTQYPLDGGFLSHKTFDAWVLMQDETNSIVTGLDKDDKYLDPSYYDLTYASNPPVMAMGDAAIPLTGVSQSYCTADDLNSGYKPSSIALASIFLNYLSDDELDEFLEYCGLGKPLVSMSATQYGSLFDTSKVGILENGNGKKYLWYALAYTSDDGAYTTCTIGCMEIDVAYTTLGVSACASASPSNPKGYWTDADNATKSKLVAKSILEHDTSGIPGISIED